MAETTFNNKCAILAELWIDYRDDPDFVEFVEYNDLGLPLAYAVTNSMAEVNDIGTALIDETFELLLSGLDIEEDTGFESLEDLLEE